MKLIPCHSLLTSSLLTIFCFLLMISCSEDEPSICGEDLFCQGELSPNPTEGVLAFSFMSSRSVQAELKVYSVSGQVLFSDTYPVEEGKNEIMLDLSAFRDGVYLVHLAAEEPEGRLVMKVVRR